MSPWLRHPKVWWVISAIGALLTAIMLIGYRDPPTLVGAQLGSVPYVAAGQEVRVEMGAVRKFGQRCSIEVSRYLIDSTKASTTLVSYQFVTAEGRELRESLSPGILVLKMVVPSDTPSGPATVVSENRYKCLLNPSTWFFPIEDTWSAQMVVTR